MTQPLDPGLRVQLMECWAAATLQPLGVVIKTNRAQTLINLLYRVRKESAVPGLDHLSISIDREDPTLVFIYNRVKLRQKEPADAREE